MGSHSVEFGSVVDLIRRTGARATPARVHVLEVLRAARGPVTHGDLEKALGAIEMDRVTLYRVLDWLCESGLANRSTDVHRVFRFSAVEPGEHGSHVHFCCETCGGVFCLSDMPPAPPSLPPGFLVRYADFNLRGSCARCGESAPSEGLAPETCCS